MYFYIVYRQHYGIYTISHMVYVYIPHTYGNLSVPSSQFSCEEERGVRDTAEVSDEM